MLLESPYVINSNLFQTYQEYSKYGSLRYRVYNIYSMKITMFKNKVCGLWNYLPEIKMFEFISTYFFIEFAKT